jgi:hypothetical protein
MNTVDWPFWGAYEDMAIWQATVLSLNIDPDTLTNTQMWIASGYKCWRDADLFSEGTEVELGKRRRLLEQRFAKQPVYLSFDEDGEIPYVANVVSLTEVGQYLSSIGRVLPPELEAMVESICLAQSPRHTEIVTTEAPKSITTPAKVSAKSPPKLREQERVIEEKIVEFGYSLTNLPSSASGKPGLKRRVLSVVGGKPPFEAKTSFKKAWQRVLESASELANKRPPKEHHHAPP